MNAESSNTQERTNNIGDPNIAGDVETASPEFGPLRVFLLCLVGFALGRLFVFPGFLDPFVPSHADLYRYFTISQEQWGSFVWLQPRPLMLAFLHALQIVRNAQWIWLILSLSSIVFVASLLLLLQRLAGFRASILSILLYSIIVFSLPSSYQIYQLDYGGMLAGTLSILAVYVWFRFYKTNPFKALCLSLLIYWFSIEMKPTFPAVMLLLAIICLLLRRDRNSLLLVVGIACVSVLVVVKDRLLGSPFLNFSNDTAIYAVKINPAQNMHALFVYLEAAVPAVLLPGLGIALILCWNAIRRRTVAVLGLLGVAIASVVPLALIPNRTLDLYSWYPAMLLCIPFLYAFQGQSATWNVRDRMLSGIVKAALPACLAAVVAALVVLPKLDQNDLYYDYSIYSYNVNVLSSLPVLAQQSLHYGFADAQQVLVSGLRGPVHPFRNRAFALRYSQLPATYVLLLRSSEASWNQQADLGPGIYSNDPNIGTFDFYVVYDQAGNFSRVLTRDQVMAIPTSFRIPVLECNLNPSQQAWTSHALEDAASCLDEAGESTAAVAFLGDGRMGNLSPLMHYYLGHAYQALGDVASARSEYRLALAAGENSFFRNALKSLLDK